MTHAENRALTRLAETGTDPDVVVAEARRIAAAHPTTDIAVRLRVLPEQYGDTDGGLDRQSNGNEVWMVARAGIVRTIMLRRDTQPRSPDAFRVQSVYRIEVK